MLLALAYLIAMYKVNYKSNYSVASQLASAQMERRLFVTNFSSENNLCTKTGSYTECT